MHETDTDVEPTPSAEPEPAHRGLLRGPFGRRVVAVTLGRFDPGWLFVGAGAALVCSAAIIPALDDLRGAEHERDVARAVADWHAERLRRYSDFVDAVDARDPDTLRSLAMTQLNLAPEDALVLGVSDGAGVDNAAVFPHLEPDFRMPIAEPARSTFLGSLVRDRRERLWVIAAGVFVIALGLVGVGKPGEAKAAEERNGADDHAGSVARVREALGIAGGLWRRRPPRRADG